jgi:hypothetical protein
MAYTSSSEPISILNMLKTGKGETLCNNLHLGVHLVDQVDKIGLALRIGGA